MLTASLLFQTKRKILEDICSLPSLPCPALLSSKIHVNRNVETRAFAVVTIRSQNAILNIVKTTSKYADGWEVLRVSTKNCEDIERMW
jgi:hypothetical protein